MSLKQEELKNIINNLSILEPGESKEISLPGQYSLVLKLKATRTHQGCEVVAYDIQDSNRELNKFFLNEVTLDTPENLILSRKFQSYLNGLMFRYKDTVVWGENNNCIILR